MSWGDGWGDMGGSIFGRRQGTGLPKYFWGAPPTPDPKTDAAGYDRYMQEHRNDPPPEGIGTDDTLTQTLFQTNPQLAWAKLLGLEAPDSNTHYSRWLGDMYTELKTKADLAGAQDKNLQYRDFFARQLPGLAERYLQLPGWQQGKNPAVSSAGRYLSL